MKYHLHHLAVSYMYRSTYVYIHTVICSYTYMARIQPLRSWLIQPRDSIQLMLGCLVVLNDDGLREVLEGQLGSRNLVISRGGRKQQGLRS